MVTWSYRIFAFSRSNQLLGVTSTFAQMSMFGRTSAVPSGGVNHERIEMAINE